MGRTHPHSRRLTTDDGKLLGTKYQLMGHLSPNTTRRYLHLVLDDYVESMPASIQLAEAIYCISQVLIRSYRFTANGKRRILSTLKIPQIHCYHWVCKMGFKDSLALKSLEKSISNKS